ncbi:MAG: hypothetical protein H0X38_02905 [Planctomycetes bacterium]|nr:hypothetical protein [Planctomycetota bacterium]
MTRDLRTRRGAVLILVAGIAALLLSISLAFLTRMRSDAEESLLAMRETQARLMLSAACNYVLEASRLGWETPGFPSAHEEGFGWIDVRDGKLGPKPVATGLDDDSRFPRFTAHRFPMYVLERPPYAIRLDAVYNQIATPIVPAAPNAGMPYLINPDPQPVTDNGWNAATHTASPSPGAFDDYAAGVPRPRVGTLNRAWFRLWRDGPATFVVTCGSGGTMGFRLRDWNALDPVTNAPLMQAADKAQFANDYETFRDLDANEVRLWYRVEWSAAVLALDYHNLDHELGTDRDHYMSWPPNASHTWAHSVRTQLHAKNLVGTISWVQRLVTEPTNW